MLLVPVLLAAAMGAAGPARAQSDDELKALDSHVHQLHQAGKYQEAIATAERYVAIAKTKRGEETAEYAAAISSLARLMQNTNRFAEAEPLYRRALAIDEKLLGSEHPTVGVRINDLALLLQATNRLAEAEPLYRRALAINEKGYGPEHPEVATVLDNLASLMREIGQNTEAERLVRRALAIDEKSFGHDHPNVAIRLNRLAAIMQATNRLTEAEQLYRRALAVYEKAYGPSHTRVAECLNSIASLLMLTDRMAEAELLQRRSLAIYEQSYGPEHADVAIGLNTLAMLLQFTNRFTEAEPLYRRGLAILEKVYGSEHTEVATSLNMLAVLLAATNRGGEAERLFRRALAILENSYGPDHTSVAIGLNILAQLLLDNNRVAEGEPLLRRALAINEKSYGPAHPNVAHDLNILAQLLQSSGRLGEAEPLMRRALAIYENSFGPDHFGVAMGLNRLAALRAEQGDWAEAAQLHRQAKPIMTNAHRKGQDVDRSGLTKGMLTSNTWNLRASARAVHRASGGKAEAREEGFELAQWALQTGAADALSQMSVRFAKGAGPLAQLIREQQDLVTRRQSEDRRLLASVGAADAKSVERLRAAIAEIDSKLDVIDKRLADEFAGYAELANPKPLTIAAVQALLNVHEAVVVFLDVPRSGSVPEETLAWAITKSEARWVSIPVGTDALAERVAKLRCGLDREGLWSWSSPSQRWEANDARCQALRPAGLTADEPLPFDLAAAYELYDKLLAPLADLTQGKSLIMVPSGPLTSLPFHVLVTEDPKQADLGTAAWLALKQPITVLPSVGSLQALRKLPPSEATEPYIAFGNPLLDGSGSASDRKRAQDARARQRCPRDPESLRPRGTPAAKGVPALATLFRGGSVDLGILRAQTPLPETADELCAVAKALGGLGREADTVWLGARATEGKLKALSREGKVARHRVLHFATHGLLAGESETILNAKAEPALVLTPPKDGATPAELEQDDGLLTASEVVQLELDADWVVLSACNTAAGDKGDAEALSGLARAFFYAKARALLVSHWYVNSDAAVKLTTRAFAELSTNPAIGRAEAFRRSMAALITKGKPEDAHPSNWAPFVLVGEGGK